MLSRPQVRGSDIVPAMVALLGERDPPSVRSFLPFCCSHLLLLLNFSLGCC